MLDKSLEYYRVVLKRRPGTPLPQASIPEGYSIVTYQTGDEQAWGQIEQSVLEFDTVEAAVQYFRTNFVPYQTEVKRRTLFIQHSSGEKIGTFTAWWNYTGNRRFPFMHWVAIKPQFQGLGLGKALIAEGVRRMEELEGDCTMYIPTQTWSHKAIRLYQWAGFELELDEEAPGGYKNETRQALPVILPLIGS